MVLIRVLLLVSPEGDLPQEVQLASEQLSTIHYSNRNIITTLILHSFQAAFGTKQDLQALHAALQVNDKKKKKYGSHFTCCPTIFSSFSKKNVLLNFTSEKGTI